MIRTLLTNYYLHKYFFALFRRFTFAGKKFRYFVHRYNATWRNERAIEVPIVWRQVQDAYTRGARVLEVGNVLSHYVPTHHTVVDKYEKAKGVINQDIVDFNPTKKFDLIVAISTFEHIGWDESPRRKQKVNRAIKHVRSLLRPGGRAIITVPVGYNPYVDEQLIAGTLGFDSHVVMQRTSIDNQWCEVNDSVLPTAKYGHPFSNANVVVVGQVRG